MYGSGIGVKETEFRSAAWLGLALLAVAVAARAAPVVVDAEAAGARLKHAERAPEAARGGEHGFRIRGGVTATLSDLIPVDPARQVAVSGWLRSASNAPTRIDFGFEPFDADRRLIELGEVHFNAGTLCRLAADAKAGDRHIVIDGSQQGYTGHSHMPVAFHARPDYSDLPNRDLSPAPASVEPVADGIRIDFVKPLTNDYPKGTVVRQHRRIGLTPQWASFTLSNAWQACRLEMVGGSAWAVAANRLRPGTRYVRLVMRVPGGPETVVHADDLALTDAGAAVPEAPPVETPFFMVRTDRLEPLYRCGETAEFRVVKQVLGLERITNGTLTARFTLDGGKQIAERQRTVTAGPEPIVFRETLAEPGFLRCDLVYHDGVRLHHGGIAAAAGFEVERITPGTTPPDELIAYWHGELARLERDVPLDLQITQTRNDSAYAGYRLSAAHFGGKRITAGLTIPKRTGPLPARVTVPGAGNASQPLSTFEGSIGLSISVFDRIFGPGDYEAFNQPRWYFYQGAEARETYYYHQAILGAMRMVKYVLTRPEWDRRNLFFTGSSQGGGFSLMLAALFADQATGVAAGAPALCDHYGREHGRRAGWPQLIETAPKAAAFARYFDAALFATHIRCPAIVSVGFIDTMCVPSSVYAAFNGIQGEKRIFNAPLYGHGSGVNSPGFEREKAVCFERWKR